MKPLLHAIADAVSDALENVVESTTNEELVDRTISALAVDSRVTNEDMVLLESQTMKSGILLRSMIAAVVIAMRDYR